MADLTYTGALTVDVTLPSQTLTVAPGDVVTVTGDDATRLARHPDFAAVKVTKKSTPTKDS